MATVSTDRVRRAREKARAEGWVMVAVKVPAHRVDDLKAYAATLGAPAPKVAEGQASLFPDLPQT